MLLQGLYFAILEVNQIPARRGLYAVPMSQLLLFSALP